MKEYEHSLKVENIEPYIEYCVKNGYKEVEANEQNRIVYENKQFDSENSHVIARLTTTKIGEREETLFDFKNVHEQKDDLKISNESIPLIVTEANRSVVQSMLDVLGFYEVANNLSKRYVYEKDNVTFEIDDYIRPEMKVVAIEGESEDVEKAYNDVMKIYNSQFSL